MSELDQLNQYMKYKQLQAGASDLPCYHAGWNQEGLIPLDQWAENEISLLMLSQVYRFRDPQAAMGTAVNLCDCLLQQFGVNLS